MVIQLKVQKPNGEEKIVVLCESEKHLQKMTVVQMRDKIMEEIQIVEDIRIIFRTEFMDDESSLVFSYGVRHMSTIQTVLRFPGGI